MTSFPRHKYEVVCAMTTLLFLTGATAFFQNTAHAQAARTAAPVVASDLPILGIAQVTNKVSDLDKARAYYVGVLGFEEAFDLKDAASKITSAYFKVNDDQYIELTPNLKNGELVRQPRIVIQSSDLQKLRGIYLERGINPGSVVTGPDGNPYFRVTAPNGTNVDFLQYVPGSKQSMARGKYLGSTRLSTHIPHAGTMVKDEETKSFFQDKLGFGRVLPGDRREYLELPASDNNLETKNPALDPKNPATLNQYTREVYGAVYHFALEVPDMRVARDLAQKRGGYDDVRVRAAMGRGLRSWLMHLFDPDGTRTEFVQTGTVDLPPLTVMAPGAPAPPIPPRANGQYGWP
jgi:catechol 2,3-dioxygenase-like lactoylglutathione lyase family enzyme